MAITKEVLDGLLKDCDSPDEFFGTDGLVKQLSKALIERMTQAELTEQLGYGKSESGEKQTENRRNGKTKKNLRAYQGPMEIKVPRDRNGDFEPKVIPKHQREWRGFDNKILSMRALGLSTKAIQEN
jgi:transposase-like protein